MGTSKSKSRMYVSTVAATVGLMAPLLIGDAATAARATSANAVTAAARTAAPPSAVRSDPTRFNFTLAWATSRASEPNLAPRSVSPAAAPASSAQPAAPAPEAPAPASAPAPPPPPPALNPDSCAAAIAYLKANANPEFRIECPGYAAGHQAMTCMDRPGLCPGEDVIAIAVVCPASYENEAHNSWVLTGQSGNVGHADDIHPQGCP